MCPKRSSRSSITRFNTLVRLKNDEVLEALGMLAGLGAIDRTTRVTPDSWLYRESLYYILSVKNREGVSPVRVLFLTLETILFTVVMGRFDGHCSVSAGQIN